MGSYEKDEILMLPATFSQSVDRNDSRNRGFPTRMRSASISIPINSLNSSDPENSLVGFTGPLRNERRTSFVQRSGPLYVSHDHDVIFQPPQSELLPTVNELKTEIYPSTDGTENNHCLLDNYEGRIEHLLRSGQLGMCNDPYCTTCPAYYNVKERQEHSRTSEISGTKFHSILYGGAKGWAKRTCSFLHQYVPGVMNPHAKIVQQWNTFFAISCLFATILDPFFVFLLSTEKDKCISSNWPMTATIVVLRSMTDFIFFLHMLLQFRLAYNVRESRVFGAQSLVDDSRRIAKNYFRGYFMFDFFIVLPLPQIITLVILPESRGVGPNFARNLLLSAILAQYIPRLCRFLPLLAGQSPTGFTFESVWANIVTYLLACSLASHTVGSFWYLFGLQRVNECLRATCNVSNITRCMEFIDCGGGSDYVGFENDLTWDQWKNNENATACFWEGGFDFGIYRDAVNLTTHQNLVIRYVYSLFWGFQQISTLAGNQVPSYSLGEVLFALIIVGTGLFSFALLVGNMQNFLQALDRRKLELFLRRRDIEQWMNHRRLPDELRREVKRAEFVKWAAYRGVNEDMLMENLPEDLQRDIRRHLFQFFHRVRIFHLLDEPILDAIYERVRTKTYVQGNKILYHGGLINKVVFIIRGKMESIGEDLIVVPLSEGDACGEELLTWCLEHSSASKDGRRIKIPKLPKHRLLSKREVRCSTHVEAFVLRVEDLEEVASLFARFSRSPRVQKAIRYESLRGLPARRLRVAWRSRKKGHADSSM